LDYVLVLLLGRSLGAIRIVSWKELKKKMKVPIMDGDEEDEPG
jgi:hypothetical protein